MPVFESGNCPICGEYSNLLMMITGYDRKHDRIVAALACPKCREKLKEKDQHERP